MSKTLREEIVDAICDGFKPIETEIVEAPDEQSTFIFVESFDMPIQVLTDDVLVPDEFGRQVKAGIALDVATILAEDWIEQHPEDA